MLEFGRVREGERVLLNPKVVIPAVDGRVERAEAGLVAAGGAQELKVG